MADAIQITNQAPSTFIVNKYDDIDGSRVNQETARGRLCFRDTNGRMTLPRNGTEAQYALYPVDWAKPLNPPPYYDGPGLNGGLPNAWNDGSLNLQETDFELNITNAFVSNWPVGVKQYDIPPHFYNLPVTSGNKCLVWDGGTFTYGSGNYVGVIGDYTVGRPVYVSLDSATRGMIAASGTFAVGTVTQKDVFGQNTITVKLKGTAA